MGKIVRETLPLMICSYFLLLVVVAIDESSGLGRYGFAMIFPWAALCRNCGTPDVTGCISELELPSLILQFPVYIVYLYKSHLAKQFYQSLILLSVLHGLAFATTLGVTYWHAKDCGDPCMMHIIFR